MSKEDQSGRASMAGPAPLADAPDQLNAVVEWVQSLGSQTGHFTSDEACRDLASQLAQQFSECDVPPHGWRCTRSRAHDGPCAAVPCPEDIEGVASGMARWKRGIGSPPAPVGNEPAALAALRLIIEHDALMKHVAVMGVDCDQTKLKRLYSLPSSAADIARAALSGAAQPEPLLATGEVESSEGAALKVTRYPLTDAGRAALTMRGHLPAAQPEREGGQ